MREAIYNGTGAMLNVLGPALFIGGFALMGTMIALHAMGKVRVTTDGTDAQAAFFLSLAMMVVGWLCLTVVTFT